MYQNGFGLIQMYTEQERHIAQETKLFSFIGVNIRINIKREREIKRQQVFNCMAVATPCS